jgi:hypothetical protein
LSNAKTFIPAYFGNNSPPANSFQFANEGVPNPVRPFQEIPEPPEPLVTYELFENNRLFTKRVMKPFLKPGTRSEGVGTEHREASAKK